MAELDNLVEAYFRKEEKEHLEREFDRAYYKRKHR